MSIPIQIPQPAGYTIERLFTENNFSIPVYQRNYSWKENEINDFWRDLNDIVKDRRNNHFFGQIVTYQHDGVQDLIDGQQRITTSTIFLAVIRDIAHDLESSHQEMPLGVKDQLRDIQRDIKKMVRGDDGDLDSLKLQTSSQSDRELQQYFHKLTHKVKLEQSVDPITDPMKNMQLAYDEFQRWVQISLKSVKSLPEQANLLNRIFEAFVSRFYVVSIVAPSQSDAFIIFETLNSRGADLRPSDIIKNHIMYLLEDDLEKTNEQWTKISDRLKADSSSITSFIRVYWAARERIVPENSLYRVLSQELTEKSAGTQFLQDLVTLVETYDVLVNPTINKNNKAFYKSSELKSQLDILSRMNVRLYYPIVIAMTKRGFTELELTQVLNAVLSIFVRHRTILNNGTNVLENGFSSIATKIWRSELTKVDEIILSFNNQSMHHNDSEVDAAWLVLSKEGGLRGQKKWALAYLLAELSYFDNEVDYYEDVFVSDRFELVRLAELDNQHDAVTEEFESRLGNWTMIEKDYHYNDKDEATRIAQLNTSIFPGNKRLSEILKQGWNNSEIEKRQLDMQKKMHLIWH